MKQSNEPYIQKEVDFFRMLWQYRKEKIIQYLQDTRRKKYKNPFYAKRSKKYDNSKEN
jgi:hypothetical protein